MGHSLSFPGILVTDVVSKTRRNEHEVIVDALSPEEPLIGGRLQFEDFKDAHILEYQLQVIAARSELASFKARSYARVKNPFEPSIIDVSEPNKMGDVNLVQSRYRVSVEVEK